ncbi:hypothetical protein GPROT1_03127 [Gammaproteobacteria bacterium]|nr:hypothetical protein GPROT1_03127 [Gammaproteobacteria bacterium]
MGFRRCYIALKLRRIDPRLKRKQFLIVRMHAVNRNFRLQIWHHLCCGEAHTFSSRRRDDFDDTLGESSMHDDRGRSAMLGMGIGAA